MNSKSSQTSDPHSLFFNILNKIHIEKIKSHTKTINVEYQLRSI